MAKPHIPLASQAGISGVLEDLRGKTEFEAMRRLKYFGTKKYPVKVVIEGRNPDEDFNKFDADRVRLVISNGFVIRTNLG